MQDEKVLVLLQEKFHVNGKDFTESGVFSDQFTDDTVLKELIDRRTAVFGGTDIRAGGANLIRWFGSLFAAHVYLYSIHKQQLVYDQYVLVEKGKMAEIQLVSPQLTTIESVNDEDYFKEM